MSLTEFGTNDAQTVKIWSNLLMREALQKTFFKRFMGRGEDAILQRVTELESNAGDQIKYDLLVQMGGYGVSGDNPLEGFEEMLTYYQDSVMIDQRRIGHAFRRMSQQRTLHDLRTDAKSNLSDRWAAIFDEIMLAQLTGVQGSLPADFAAHGSNALVAPDATHVVTSTGWSDTVFNTNHIEYLVEKAQNLSPLIRPVKIDGGSYYCLLVHPNNITDLRTSTSSNNWLDITKFAYMGKPTDHPIFRGSIGVWNNCVIHSTPRIPITTGSPNYSRCLLLGAQSGVVAFANPYSKFDRNSSNGDLLMKWFERDRDYGNERGIGTGAVFGMKPCIFNSKRFGMIQFDLKATAHTS